MAIPQPPSNNNKEEGNPEANCPEYKPIMGNYCEFYVTRTGECIKAIGKCDGFGVLK